jgi:geranylgeranyl diphosphate synthase type II
MRYSVFAGGKRLRPLLCLATARALNCPDKKVLAFACAVELVHTFTLVHDDLPAMDNAGLRRGKPTAHKVFGEALAILAGDALNTLAFKIIRDFPSASFELSKALLEVVEGQVADLESGGRKLSLPALISIHHRKTGALLRACARGAALISRAPAAKIKALTSYADHLGLAFQIADDILDATATKEKLGKPVRADIGKGFPYVAGLKKATALAKEEKNKARVALRRFDEKADLLREIAEYVLSRNK